MGILMNRGDEERGAQRVARLIGRYAERFDPPSRAEFYTSLANKVARVRDEEVAFIHGDDPPKKPVQGEPSQESARKRA